MVTLEIVIAHLKEKFCPSSVADLGSISKMPVIGYGCPPKLYSETKKSSIKNYLSIEIFIRHFRRQKCIFGPYFFLCHTYAKLFWLGSFSKEAKFSFQKFQSFNFMLSIIDHLMKFRFLVFIAQNLNCC